MMSSSSSAVCFWFSIWWGCLGFCVWCWCAWFCIWWRCIGGWGRFRCCCPFFHGCCPFFRCCCPFFRCCCPNFSCSSGSCGGGSCGCSSGCGSCGCSGSCSSGCGCGCSGGCSSCFCCCPYFHGCFWNIDARSLISFRSPISFRSFRSLIRRSPIGFRSRRSPISFGSRSSPISIWCLTIIWPCFFWAFLIWLLLWYKVICNYLWVIWVICNPIIFCSICNLLRRSKIIWNYEKFLHKEFQTLLIQVGYWFLFLDAMASLDSVLSIGGWVLKRLKWSRQPKVSLWGWDHCVAAHNQHQASDYLRQNINHNEHIKSNIVSFSSEETMKAI